MTDWELMYVNLLEITATQLRDMEQELRERAQDIEKEIRNLKLNRELSSRQNVTPPEAAAVSDPEKALEGTH